MALRFDSHQKSRRRFISFWGAALFFCAGSLLLGQGCGSPEAYRQPLGQADARPDADGGASLFDATDTSSETDALPPDAPRDVPADVPDTRPDASPDAEVPAACRNGLKDGSETDIDCGGLGCAPCPATRSCLENRDCATGPCVNGFCAAAASCKNGMRDGEESDNDCGGTQCGPCADARMCRASSDCSSRSCLTVCLPATCTDGIRNGTEGDRDCGGSCPVRCAGQQTCQVNGDCQSGSCTHGLCDAPPLCTDGVRNGSETDKDCGGTCPNHCAVGQSCKVPGDCVTGNCTDGTCRNALACQNGAKGEMETDIDCGGPDCPKCNGTKQCLMPRDCVSGVCANGTCIQAPLLRVQQQSWETQNTTGDIKFRFQILNDGPVAAPKLTDLKVRYWFNSDGYVGMYGFNCDYAAIGTSYVQGRVVTLPATIGSSGRPSNAYLEISFSDGAFPAPAAGTQITNTTLIQARFHSAGFNKSFDQTNDYSYEPGHPTPADEPQLTLYLNDVLVWGTEP